METITSYFHKFYLSVTHPGRLVVDIELFVGSVIVDLGFDFGPVGGASVLGVDSTDRPTGGLAVMDVGLETVPSPLTHCVHILHLFQHFLNHSLKNTQKSVNININKFLANNTAILKILCDLREDFIALVHISIPSTIKHLNFIKF